MPAAAVAKKQPRNTREARRKRRPNFPGLFKQFLQVRDDSEVLGERAEGLKDRIKDGLKEYGEEDDRGHFYLDLEEPIEFKDRKGKVHQYTTLKAELHVTPSQPTPDPELAEELLRRLGLWLTKAQEKKLTEVAQSNPFVSVVVVIDPDAIAEANLRDDISDEDYEGILVEQKPSYQFRPSEA